MHRACGPGGYLGLHEVAQGNRFCTGCFHSLDCASSVNSAMSTGSRISRRATRSMLLPCLASATLRIASGRWSRYSPSPSLVPIRERVSRQVVFIHTQRAVIQIDVCFQIVLSGIQIPAGGRSSWLDSGLHQIHLFVQAIS